MTLTRTELAYVRIREDILNGDLQPDSPLRLDMLRGKYGLSYSPLREALVRLQGEGLVRLYEQRGYRVSRIHKEDIWDILNTRIMIETTALRDAIRRGVDADLITRAHDRLRLADLRYQTDEEADKGDLLAELRSAHRDFHLSLIASASSPRQYCIAYYLFTETERYRTAFLENFPEGASVRSPWIRRHGRDNGSEHSDLADAVLKGDADRAIRLLRAHYRQTAEIIASQVAPLVSDKA